MAGEYGNQSDLEQAMTARATAPSREWLLSQIPGGDAPIADGEMRAGKADIEASMPQRVRDWLAQNFASGGAGDVRNVMAAAGPAAQAAGGFGNLLQWAARAGMPAKAPAALGAADQMFDVAQAAPVMAGGAQGGYVDPRLLIGAAVTGVGAYGGYKVKQLMDSINEAREAAIRQVK